MKIAIISDYIDPANWGGAAKVAAEEAITLRDLGHDLLVVAPSGSDATISGVSHCSWWRGAGIIHLWQLWRHIRREGVRFQPDLAILHQPLSGAMFQHLHPGVATRYFFHSSWTDEVRSRGGRGLWLRSAVEAHVLDRAEKIFVTSRFTLDILGRTHAAQRTKAIENPLGIRGSDYGRDLAARDQIREIYGISGDDRIVCVFRRLVPRTGVSLFIDALAQCPGITALIGGAGAEEGALKRRAESLGVNDRARFLGYVSDAEKVKILQGADAAVVPSLELEGFGLSTLEAMACGCPVVVTPVGNNPDLVRLCSGGTIAKSTAPEDLAAAVAESLQKKWDRKRLSDQSRSLHNWESHAEMLLL